MEGTIFNTISDFITTYLPVLVSFVGSFALLATITPNKTDDKIVGGVLKFINFFGGNFGKAANKDE